MEQIRELMKSMMTYEPVDGIDYRILLEADFLVNLYEDNEPMEAIQNVLKQIFRTETGRWLCITMFGMEC